MPPVGKFDTWLIWYDYGASRFFLEATESARAAITISTWKNNPNKKIRYWKIPYPMDKNGYHEKVDTSLFSDFMLEASQDPEIDQTTFLDFVQRQFSLPGEFDPFVKISP